MASGPNTDEWEWTRGFFEELLRKGKWQLDGVYGLSLHHYAANLSRGKIADWEKSKGSALQFAPIDWYELLREGQRIETMIENHWRIMGEWDTEHRVKLIVDEWGPWYRSGSEATPLATIPRPGRLDRWPALHNRKPDERHVQRGRDRANARPRRGFGVR